MKHLEFVKIVNKYLWKSKEYIKELKNYQESLKEHIEWLKAQINQATNTETKNHYKNNLQIRKQELKMVEIAIIDDIIKTKQYIKLEKECNIFG